MFLLNCHRVHTISTLTFKHICLILKLKLRSNIYTNTSLHQPFSDLYKLLTYTITLELYLLVRLTSLFYTIPYKLLSYLGLALNLNFDLHKLWKIELVIHYPDTFVFLLRKSFSIISTTVYHINDLPIYQVSSNFYLHQKHHFQTNLQLTIKKVFTHFLSDRYY